MKLEGKVAIVTGGGGSIGRAIALKLSGEGAAVALADINLEAAEKVANELESSGGKALPVKVDVRDRQSIRDMVAAVIGKYEKIDILINNAGGSARKDASPFYKAKEEVLDRVLDMNLKGTIFCTRAVIEHMIERGNGKIVNLGSVCGVQGLRMVADYSAAKGGIIAFTKTLAMEVGEFGINVNCVSPGIVPRPEESLERALRTNYLGRACLPEDIAELVSFLVTEKASFITGQNYIIDGGRSLGLKGD